MNYLRVAALLPLATLAAFTAACARLDSTAASNPPMRPVAIGRWQPIGLSGGGAMFTPAISPADPKRMMVNCDMSAAYTTDDGGHTWRMIHWSQLHASTRCRPAFHPT